MTIPPPTVGYEFTARFDLTETPLRISNPMLSGKRRVIDATFITLTYRATKRGPWTFVIARAYGPRVKVDGTHGQRESVNVREADLDRHEWVRPFMDRAIAHA